MENSKTLQFKTVENTEAEEVKAVKEESVETPKKTTRRRASKAVAKDDSKVAKTETVTEPVVTTSANAVYAAILGIQHDLHVSKSRKNSYGNYNYRSCEDILEAVKPLLQKYQTFLTIRDEVIPIGGRFYIQATAKLTSVVDGSFIENTALAREAEEKKGMDASQITGTSSSYARKYALNGLFSIDDTKDADTNEFKQETTTSRSDKPVRSATSSAGSQKEQKQPHFSMQADTKLLIGTCKGKTLMDAVVNDGENFMKFLGELKTINVQAGSEEEFQKMKQKAYIESEKKRVAAQATG